MITGMLYKCKVLQHVIKVDALFFRRGYLFWSTSNELWKSRFDGSDALLLLDTDLDVVGKPLSLIVMVPKIPYTMMYRPLDIYLTTM